MHSPHSTSDFSMDSDSVYTQYINLEPSTAPLPMLSNIQSLVSNQMSNSQYSKLLAKNKRLMKRENAKYRLTKKKIENVEKNEHINDFIVKSEEISNMNEDSLFLSDKGNCTNEKERKKAIQKLRNRVSAQQSRDRKKLYLDNLEKENTILKEKIKELENKNTMISEENKNFKENKEKKGINPGVFRFGMAIFSFILLVFMIKKGEKIENFNPLMFQEEKMDKIEMFKEIFTQPENKIERILEQIKMEYQNEDYSNFEK